MTALTALWAEPHHDGSPRYVSNSHPDLGDTVQVYLRAPHEAGVTRAYVRAVADAEPYLIEAKIERTDDADTWFGADLPIRNQVTSYRWLTDGGPHRFQWINGAGATERGVSDTADFRITTFPAPPEWAGNAIFYQIFPDRFASSGPHQAPDWAIPQSWDDPVVGAGPETAFQWYGGDLDGILDHLDYIQSLNINTVYLTPIFPSFSNHRYDAQTFDHVDPVLGGDDAFTRLADALHARGMRLVGDLTTNHSGATHDWFRSAVADSGSTEAGFFLFDEHPHRYMSWFDEPSLPKFDHRNPELRRRLYGGADSIVAKWLRGPGNLDGWRIDVANMTGRHGNVDLNQDVARTIRATMSEVAPDSFLLAEHCHDYTRDLVGDGWHGTMNYAGFTGPVWSWLRPSNGGTELPVDTPLPLPQLSGPQTVATIREFLGGVPWETARHNLNLLSSHDSPRIRSALKSSALLRVAIGLLVALPGIPSLYSGDEIGLEGLNGEDGRRPFPWNRDRWDTDTLSSWQTLLKARRDLPALRGGGLRWLAVADDSLLFLRELADERVLVQANRADTARQAIPARHLGGGSVLPGTAGTADLRSADDLFHLPTDGPAIRLWLVPR